MKKYLIGVTSVLVIFLIIYIPAKSHYEASNKTPDYEYYYNNSDSKDGNNMTVSSNPTETATTGAISKDFKPAPLDTKSDSITALVNKEYALPADYVPKDLVIPNVPFDFQYMDEKRYLRKKAATALEQMFQAATADNITLIGVSGYRSYGRQNSIFTKNVRERGYQVTYMVSAVPGHSEHQTGLAIDISCQSMHGDLEEEFSDTAEGKWVKANCYKYGYILRYPKSKSDITGYIFEPWHIRYVGVKLATYLHDNNLTLDEYYGYKPSKEIAETYGSGVDVEDVNELSKSKSLIKPKASATPKPTAKPKATATPKQKKNETTTPAPSAEPKPESAPAATPQPTPEPTVKPTEKPTPEPTVTPTQKPDESKETEKPSETN